jgi:hypothetical protein
MAAWSPVAVIGSAKMLRSIANVCFGEAASQRLANSRTAALGRTKQNFNLSSFNNRSTADHYNQCSSVKRRLEIGQRHVQKRRY